MISKKYSLMIVPGLTGLTGFHAINISPGQNTTAFQLNDLNFYLYAAQKMKPSFESALF